MEEILMEGVCNRIKSKVNVQTGKAQLTSKSFIYYKHSLKKSVLLGAFAALTKPSFDFEVPLTDIASISNTKYGLNNHVLVMTLKDGTEYKFAVAKYPE